MSEQTTGLSLNSLQANQTHFINSSNADFNPNHFMVSFGNALPKINPSDNAKRNADEPSWKSTQAFQNIPTYTFYSPTFNTNIKSENTMSNQLLNTKLEGTLNSQELQYPSSSAQQFTQKSQDFHNEFKIPYPFNNNNNKGLNGEKFEEQQIKNLHTYEMNSHPDLESISYKPLILEQLGSWSEKNGMSSQQQPTPSKKEGEDTPGFKNFSYAHVNQQKQLNSVMPSNVSSGSVGKIERNDVIKISEREKQIVVHCPDDNRDNQQSIVSQFQQALDLKDKIIQNTFKISFLENVLNFIIFGQLYVKKDRSINLMDMMEKYVLVCAENEKLSFGFVEKLSQLDQLNGKIKELTTQKENWKTLYENKVSEISALSKEYGLLSEMLKDIQSSSQELQNTLNLQVKNSKQNSEKQEQVLIQENFDLTTKIKNLIVEAEDEERENKRELTDGLQEKLIKMLDENEELNRLLSERVDEVAYLQKTIKSMQDTYSSQQLNDSRFQKVVNDLEAEIRRMDATMEEIIKEKKQDNIVKTKIERENNELKNQLQQKRKELEEQNISLKTSQIIEGNARKKQDQIEELLFKIERMERNKNDYLLQIENYKAELFQVKEQLKKLEKIYETKSNENIELIIKNTGLTATIKQLKIQKDASLIEKDLQQALFEKKQLKIQLNECQYEQERTKVQLEVAQKEIESLTKQKFMQKSNSVDREISLQDQINQLKYDSTNEQESQRYKAKIEEQKEHIINLQNTVNQIEKAMNEQNYELQEKQLIIKQLQDKLERISVIEGTLHAADNENTILLKFKEDADALIEELKCRIVKISIENERLHKIIEELKKRLETEREQAQQQEHCYQEQNEKIEEEMVSERERYQEIIKQLEIQISERNHQEIFIKEETNRYKKLQEDYLALKREFELAISMLKQRDQQIKQIEGQYNQRVSEDRNSSYTKKLEHNLKILSAENQRLNKILLDRVRSSYVNQ